MGPGINRPGGPKASQPRLSITAGVAPAYHVSTDVLTDVLTAVTTDVRLVR